MVSEHNHQKKIALINDITGFGRCSVAVELPAISMMKVQCCVIPTAILSNHTGFNSFYFDDYTPKMESYIEQWKNLNLAFNGICSGFLGSQSQISIVSDFIRDFSDKDTVVIVDPVMGDNGRKYSTYTDEMCDMMKQLAGQAHILTPNLTEACILTDTEYTEKWHEKDIIILGEKLLSLGPEKIVITGTGGGDAPVIFKYNDPNYTDQVYDANNNYNISVMGNYKSKEEQNQLLQKRILLQDTQTPRWFTLMYGIITDAEFTMYFYDGLKLLVLQYLDSFNDFNYT